MPEAVLKRNRATCEREIATAEREQARVKRASADDSSDPATKQELLRQAVLHAESARLHDALACTYEAQDAE